jgi:hypothetical protein
MPSLSIIRIKLETSEFLNKLAIFKHSFVKTDNIKSGNDLPIFPETLPAGLKTFSAQFY